MMISSKIRPTHLQRQAYVYLRQSTTKQVQQNTESAVNQRSMQERLLSFGWKPDQITVVDSDLGCSGTEATARAGFQFLVTEVSLGRAGVVMGYDVSRLARNCRDWYHLIEICSLFDTLIADTDGLYHPSDFNDRLLLGLKGTMSEAELHSLRLRLDAGRLSKAKRGELVQHLPTGYVRTEGVGVALDPDVHVQSTLRLVFEKFLELGSIRKTLIYFVRHEIKLPRRQTSGLEAGNTIWKSASAAALASILENPAYAGVFVYGRRRGDPRRTVPGRPSTGRIRRGREEWLCVVKDVYPSYISRSTFEDIQQRIAINRQKYEEHMRHKGAERRGAALLQGLVACRQCGRQMMVRYRENSFEYICFAMTAGYASKPCQYITGRSIDEAVVREFMSALSQVQIDGLTRIQDKHRQEEQRLVAQLEREVARCEYEARLAEKQYNKVDPDNRHVAGTLEKRWEEKLRHLQTARQRLEDAQAATGSRQVHSLTPELRKAFLDVGQNLPALWPRLSNTRKKELLRTLVRQVHLQKRKNEGEAEVRIVWIGDHVADLVVGVPAHTRRDGQKERDLLAEVSRLEEQGMGDKEVAEELNRRGIRTCRLCAFSSQTVQQLRLRHGILSPIEKARRGSIAGYFKLPELATLVPVHPTRLYRLIGCGRIQVDPDPTYKCYLFDKAGKPVELIRMLLRGEVQQVSFKKGASRWLS
jgi:DNA invertase Pin-like site-specific DNA recombinase